MLRAELILSILLFFCVFNYVGYAAFYFNGKEAENIADDVSDASMGNGGIVVPLLNAKKIIFISCILTAFLLISIKNNIKYKSERQWD